MATMELDIEQSTKLVIQHLQYVRAMTTDSQTRKYIDMAIVRQNKIFKDWKRNNS